MGNLSGLAITVSLDENCTATISWICVDVVQILRQRMKARKVNSLPIVLIMTIGMRQKTYFLLIFSFPGKCPSSC